MAQPAPLMDQLWSENAPSNTDTYNRLALMAGAAIANKDVRGYDNIMSQMRDLMRPASAVVDGPEEEAAEEAAENEAKPEVAIAKPVKGVAVVSKEK